jgi:hypothetical protein
MPPELRYPVRILPKNNARGRTSNNAIQSFPSPQEMSAKTQKAIRQ